MDKIIDHEHRSFHAMNIKYIDEVKKTDGKTTWEYTISFNGEKKDVLVFGGYKTLQEAIEMHNEAQRKWHKTENYGYNGFNSGGNR